MNGAQPTVHVDELTAVPADAGPVSWTVWRGPDQVGELEQRQAGAQVWLSGCVDGDLVAEGPTPLSVLRRLACRSTLRRASMDPASPVRT